MFFISRATLQELSGDVYSRESKAVCEILSKIIVNYYRDIYRMI